MRFYVIIIVLWLQLSMAMIDTEVKEYLIGRTKDLINDIDNILNKYGKVSQQFCFAEYTDDNFKPNDPRLHMILQRASQEINNRLTTDPSINNLMFSIDSGFKIIGTFNASRAYSILPLRGSCVMSSRWEIYCNNIFGICEFLSNLSISQLKPDIFEITAYDTIVIETDTSYVDYYNPSYNLRYVNRVINKYQYNKIYKDGKAGFYLSKIHFNAITQNYQNLNILDIWSFLIFAFGFVVFIFFTYYLLYNIY